MSRVLTPRTMTRFKCNEKGCCCRGWGIPFPPEDVARLLLAFPPEDRDAILEGAQADVSLDGTLKSIRLRQEGEERACQFVTPAGLCGVHARMGPEVLPHLCRSFPTFAHDQGGQLELHFDAVCPEVLERLDADEGFELVELDLEEGEDLEVRARRPLALPTISMGSQELSFPQLRLIRARILETLTDEGRPPMEALALVNFALLRTLGGQPPEEFAVDPADPAEAFDAFFEGCMGIHEGRILARMLEDYRPFIHAIELGEVEWEAIHTHLRPDPEWRRALDPGDPALAPLIRRYLCHRFFSAFDRSPSANRLSFTYGTINHCLAVAFRYAVGLGAWLDRPVDRALLKVGMGASEYVFRVFRMPQWSMPWFGLESVPEGEEGGEDLQGSAEPGEPGEPG